ncbi:uncharacterized protein [Zea mays]|uniref:uncharacterized protein n=1 Tax=Zea mays TaxID=4577 RepID=UPI0009A95B9E|nr:uncharacterized protein LOC109945042 [Zea mays]|eukprot:XP_020406412.1 uncharacterized protein LOC109945042 [Zea mays]
MSGVAQFEGIALAAEKGRSSGSIAWSEGTTRSAASSAAWRGSLGSAAHDLPTQRRAGSARQPSQLARSDATAQAWPWRVGPTAPHPTARPPPRPTLRNRIRSRCPRPVPSRTFGPARPQPTSRAVCPAAQRARVDKLPSPQGTIHLPKTTSLLWLCPCRLSLTKTARPAAHDAPDQHLAARPRLPVAARRAARSTSARCCRVDYDPFRASRNRRSSFGDQEIKLFKFYKAEDPEHMFGEGCPWCNLCSGKEEGVEVDLQEFQDFDEFED